MNGMRAIAVAMRESPCRGQCLDPTSGDRLFERYTTSWGALMTSTVSVRVRTWASVWQYFQLESSCSHRHAG